MNSTLSARNVLVISEPSPWVPAAGQPLEKCVLEVERAGSLEEVRARTPRQWDVVAFRVESLGSVSPAEALVALREIAPEATFLPVTGVPDPREALLYLKQGAFEYLEEPLDAEDFLRALADAIENRDAFREILDLNRALESQKEQLLTEKQELEQKNRELEAVSRLARALASTLDIGEILDQLIGCIRDTFGFGSIVVGLMDQSKVREEAKVGLQEQSTVSEDALSRMQWELRDGRRLPWIRAVLQEGRTLHVEDPATHPQTRDTPLAEIHRNPFVKLPMVASGQIVGSITAEDPKLGGPAAEKELGILGIFADTAAMAVENARLYQTMRELSVRDELTGLYNRRHLLERLEAEWNHAQRHDMPLALLMLDIDYFKHLNDKNDHLTGDAALRKLAAALLRNTRGIDTVARYGGEEFVILLPRATGKNAGTVAEKLRRVVETTQFEGEEVVPGGTLTVSVGAAAYPEDASTPGDLMKRADWALYQAKSGGRNRVYVVDSATQVEAG
jgi:diguanylate cyclase (GGDEF)-like protein